MGAKNDLVNCGSQERAGKLRELNGTKKGIFNIVIAKWEHR